MLSFTASLKIYVAVEPCDMRKSFEGLSALTATALHEDVRDGALFVFSNHRRNRLKILYWDGTGLWVMAKRLERERSRGRRARRKSSGLRSEALAMLTGGVDLRGAKMRPWYDRGD